MLREFTIPRNPGFYESILSNSDEFIDYEEEDKELIVEKYNIKDKNFMVEYEYENFTEFKFDVMEALAEEIVQDINGQYLEYNEMTYISTDFTSPMFYNYGTDRGFALVDIPGVSLQKIKDLCFEKYLEGTKELIKDNFTSYDGFISNYSNNIDDWKQKSIFAYDYNELGTLLHILHSQIVSKDIWIGTIGEISNELKMNSYKRNFYYFNEWINEDDFCEQLGINELIL